VLLRVKAVRGFPYLPRDDDDEDVPLRPVEFTQPDLSGEGAR